MDQAAYNAKNYTEPGGETTVIGGTLAFGSGSRVRGFPLAIPCMPYSDATTVAALREDFNALLTAMRASGLMRTDD